MVDARKILHLRKIMNLNTIKLDSEDAHILQLHHGMILDTGNIQTIIVPLCPIFQWIGILLPKVLLQ